MISLNQFKLKFIWYSIILWNSIVGFQLEVAFTMQATYGTHCMLIYGNLNNSQQL